jgi:hypothetical protein
MSPVAKWHKQCSDLIFGACVPLPHPGGPVFIIIACVRDMISLLLMMR